MITKEQIWYMFYVYPEYISQEEAKKEYNWRKNDCELNADESFLQSITNVINKINDNENDKKLSLNEINLIRSSTWITDNFDDIHRVLDETIKDFVSDDQEIINIESKTSKHGSSRFWIYTKKISN